MVGRVLAAALMLCLASGDASAQAHDPLETPGWMSGYWLDCDEAIATSESWMGAGRDTMLGVNLSVRRLTHYEFLRISGADGRLALYAMPNGRAPPTIFTMVSHEGQRIVFENAAHDFPQRLTYWREGDVLHARVENLQGEGFTQSFHRAAHDAACAG